MKKMRRVVSALAVLAMLFTTFSCSSPETPENPKSEKEKDDAGKTDEPGSSDKPAQGSIVIDEGTSDASEEVGIKLTITVPANSSSLAIFRWDITENPNEFVGREIYETKNESNTAKTITFYDKYGIKKDHSYKYATATNYGERTEWREAVKAKADGWELPVLDKAPKASFEKASLTYTQVPHVSFKNSENYDYVFSPAYLFKTPWWMVEGAKESDGDFVDWDYGLWFGYNTEEPNEKSFEIGEDHRGLLLTLNDYNLTVFVDKGKNLNYVAYYEADAFDFPKTIYAENKVVEEGNDLVFTIPVPAGTHNVSLMKYDEKLKDYFEIASKPYPGDEPNPGKTEIKLKDLYEHEKGKEGEYFVTYDGKRYDGEKGIKVTPNETGHQRPVISNIKIEYKDSKLTVKKAPTIQKAKNDKYWLILDYYDAKDPENGDAHVSIWFHEDCEGKTADLRKEQKLINDQELTLRTLRFNYTIEENGLMWDVHYNVPFEDLDVPGQIKIKKEMDTSGIQAENLIQFDVDIPRKMTSVAIQRREVDSKGAAVTGSDWEEVAAQWPILNDPNGWQSGSKHKFIERYTVEKDHYYEYRVEYLDETWNLYKIKNFGIHKAGADGYPKPVFKTGSNYPNISLNYDAAKRFVFKLENESIFDTVDLKGGAKPNWAVYSFMYAYEYNPWVGDEENNRSFVFEDDEFKTLATGCYPLTSFNFQCQHAEDYFDARIYYDINELDSSKIPFNFWRTAEELTDGGYKMTVGIPYDLLGKVWDITVQRREKPATDADKWSEDLDLDKDMVGYIGVTEADKGRWNKDSDEWHKKIDFYDYYGYEAGKTYQTRALIRYKEDEDSLDLEIREIPLGELTPSKNGLTAPILSGTPNITWEAEKEMLDITNSNDLNLTFTSGMPATWGITTANPLRWDLALSYQKQGDAKHGFWASFQIKPEFVPSEWGNRVREWNGLGTSYTLNCYEYGLLLYVPGQGIAQYIKLNVDDLDASAKSLKYPN